MGVEPADDAAADEVADAVAEDEVAAALEEAAADEAAVAAEDAAAEALFPIGAFVDEASDAALADDPALEAAEDDADPDEPAQPASAKHSAAAKAPARTAFSFPLTRSMCSSNLAPLPAAPYARPAAPVTRSRWR